MEFEVGENSFEPYADQPVYDELLADMDECLCVHTLDVDAAHRNAGLGTQLMQRAMAVMSQEYPGVPCNRRCMSSYRHTHFAGVTQWTQASPSLYSGFLKRAT
jgi:GNAT superfamily N-acetyltransferase